MGGCNNNKRLSALHSTSNMITRSSRKKQKLIAMAIPSRTGNGRGNGTATVDDGLLSPLLDLPIDLRVTIFNMLGQQTQEELTNLTLVSKQVYEDCKQHGIEWKIIPTIEITPTYQQNDSIRGISLMQNLTRHLLNNETNEKLQCYSHLKIKNLDSLYVEYNGQHNDELFEIARGIQLDGILSLDISSLFASTICHTNSFPYALSNILPNLHEINISNMCLFIGSLSKISRNCPLIEKVMWNNIKDVSHVYLNGYGMHRCNNLKEIHMNDSAFYCMNTRVKEEISNLTDPAFSNRFIFHRCCKTLERVSIRNAKCFGVVHTSIPQNALIKFVRNAPPTLRWFRSDLTIENMNMLRLERPEIELLN
jgi:hypothetical protein